MQWSKIDRLSQVESACILFQGWYFSPSVWERWVNILEEQYDVVLLWDIYNPPSEDVWCHLRSLVGLVDLYAWSLGGMFAMDIASKYPGFINQLVTFNSFPCFKSKKDWPGAPKGSFNNILKNLSSPDGMRKNFLLPVVLGGNNNKRELSYLDNHIHNSNDIEGHTRLLDKLFTLDNTEAWRNIACKQMHFFSEADNIVPKSIYSAWQKVPNILSRETMEFVQEDASIKWISISGHSHASFLLDPQIYVKVLEKEYDSESVEE